ncbi:MAG: glucose-6-phosphate isomerase [Pseudomonadota bacterium]
MTRFDTSSDLGLEAAWAALADAATRLRGQSIGGLFATDPGRFEALSARFGAFTLDLSKEKLDPSALADLLALARAADVEGQRDQMASGARWNLTEGRAVLHMALRGGAEAPAGDDVAGTLARFLGFAEEVRSGIHAGAGGPITDVVNIGIGGSDLGPAMAVTALAPDCDGPRLHFVSNVDGAHLADTLPGLDPARTLVVVASKSFTTLETMTNARTAHAWLAAAIGDRAGHQMAAVSSNVAGAREFGIAPERVFGFWDWVGGRYSLWSSVGLPIALAIGAQRFRALLAGAAEMDRHFLTAPLEGNLPVLLGLVGIWRRNAMGWPTVALIPYDQRLARFPAYVQQLDMESSGKRVTRGGAPVTRPTGPVIWGEPGTNAQHSFFQLLHQGSDIVPVDFLLAATPRETDMPGHHTALMANCLAQGQALAFGRSEAEVRAQMAAKGMDPAEIDRLAPHRTFPGDRPSTTLLYRRLDPESLGQLVALYEHKVFVQGAVWGINSFDQWGVELGKDLARDLIPILEGGEPSGLDASTMGLLSRISDLREG